MDETETCPFCLIVNRQVASQIVHEEADVMAFLDCNPIRPGHLQLVPRAHYPLFDDLPAALASRLICTGQALARRLKSVYGVRRVGFVFTGNDVDHCHAHLVPLHAATDITSLRYFDAENLPLSKRKPPTPAELRREARRLTSPDTGAGGQR